MKPIIPAEECVLILLAAGRSERFGDTDKLQQEYLGQPLAFHVVTALESVPFKARIAVCSGSELDFGSRGYRVIHNDNPGDGMSGSVKLGVAAAREIGCAAVVVALADMPRVTATHIYRLLDATHGPDAVVASSNGVHPTPPAVFGADQFEALLTLEGDEGARAMVRAGRHVIAPESELLDVDRPEDLERLRTLR
ncbi:nucleotidyltransferase family protein [Sphingomonas sp. CARO-RG-8B-R24-01]|uniref:nucleotidyltransferase family protein n=1 Tax=Sphingomonas sp. CARO-RG-8B-R24-01 TaxID=2914831 RepID=UPI001F591A86|nr:nucleotidyltransferase family protein [Sphingomonas sp. CARO-RG-8B-R24-01]